MDIDLKFVEEVKGALADIETGDGVAKQYSGIVDKDIASGKYRDWKNYIHNMDKSVKQVIGAKILTNAANISYIVLCADLLSIEFGFAVYNLSFIISK